MRISNTLSSEFDTIEKLRTALNSASNTLSSEFDTIEELQTALNSASMYNNPNIIL